MRTSGSSLVDTELRSVILVLAQACATYLPVDQAVRRTMDRRATFGFGGQRRRGRRERADLPPASARCWSARSERCSFGVSGKRKRRRRGTGRGGDHPLHRPCAVRLPAPPEADADLKEIALDIAPEAVLDELETTQPEAEQQ
jgi:hypothetical protein